MATVSGAGGIGKSELARKYAYIHREDFDKNITWMNAETQESPGIIYYAR
jgi:MinD superfamily P-loop ATPase